MVEALELVISPAPGAIPVRVAIAKRITTVGAAGASDIRLATVAPQWAVLRREGDAISVRLVIAGTSRSLAPGESLVADGVTLTVERAASGRDAGLERMTSALASARDPDEALGELLAGAIDAAGADSGAVIITRDAAYTVVCARDAAGTALPNAAELLSDTIVRDVLGTGERVLVTDVGQHGRYAAVPSVASLRLRSVLCLPMRLEGRTLGALFLGKRDGGFAERTAADLRVAAAMAVPLLAQLGRPALAAAGDELIGESEPMHRVRQLVARVAPSDLSVLIQGASGTGKELVARAIHAGSRRAAATLIAINCAAVPDSLLGAELFGYRKGAFTGAVTDRAGLIEAAGGSTLFLDELGDMPLPMQASLLRVLEQREVTRLGENHPRPVDFRLIAATHRDLDAEVAAGRFREDLLFRIREMTIPVPPLRERGDDLSLLAGYFLRQVEAQLGVAVHSLGADATAALRRHLWPGNVRELRATMRRAAILADERVIRAEHLQLGPAPATATSGSDLGDTSRPLAEARDQFVRRYVAAALERAGGNREAAARELGIGVRTLYRYID
jgi:transcriptional regulator with GAF, ATPase, and Fis domain